MYIHYTAYIILHTIAALGVTGVNLQFNDSGETGLAALVLLSSTGAAVAAET